MKLHTILHRFADMRITSVLLLVFALETLAGTLMQAKYGLYAAQQLFFHNWFGVPLVGAIALLNLCAVLFFRLSWKLRNSGLLLLHIGLILLLASAGIGWMVSEQGYLDLGPGEMAQRAESGTEWELAFRVHDDSGATVWSLPLSALRKGSALALGPHFPELRISTLVENGMVGPNNQIMTMKAGNDPESWSPAISLSNGVTLAPTTPPWSPQQGQQLGIRRKAFALPFAIHLKSFHREYHPGTQIASSYSSKVVVMEGPAHREVTISMNQPLRIGDYTVFQSSWSTDPQTGMDRSTFSVMRNPLRNGPYIATLLIALGLLLHMAIKIQKSFFATSSILLFCFLGIPSPNYALEVPASLKQLPILADGRMKPLETYAHHLLLQISGKSTFSMEDSLGQKVRMNSMEWFASVLLGSDLSNEPLFLVENPEVRDALGLIGKERDRYTWKQMQPLGMKLDSLAHFAETISPEKRSAMQRDLLRIADSWNRYYTILHALDFAVPNPVMKPYTDFLDFAKHSFVVRPRLDSLLKISPDSLDVNGRAYLTWVNGVLGSADTWASVVFPTIPTKNENQLVWASPGELLLREGIEDSVARIPIEAWASLRMAWLKRDQPQLEKAADLLRAAMHHSATKQGINTRVLRWEHWYNLLDPFYRALVLYFIMLIPAFLGLRLRKEKLIQSAAFLGLFALALQGTGILLRMVITGRPPVTNLYETFVFASACAVFLLLTWGHFRKFSPAPFLAALSGALLLLLARRYGSDGDTMPVLAAVLNSNFWLAIHVLTITLGYAGVVAAGMIAHWHLVLLRTQSSPEAIRSASSLVKEIMAFGLLFTFVGTLLGGIWADQSWGRFWGWDPKENGALLIILWVAFQFHAVPAGFFREKGFSLASLVAIQTVVFAWFGVNLMGVGLHSYGFTQGTLFGIIAFALLEVVFAAWAFRGTKVPQ